MSKQLRNALIAGAVIVLVGAVLAALGDSSLSSTAISVGLGAFIWVTLQNLSGNRAVANVPDADRNRLLAEAPPSGQALVYVLREGFRGRAVGWELVLDNQPMTQLKSPRFTRIVVAPGEHTLLARTAGAAGSQSEGGSLAFTLAPDETAVFSLHIEFRMTSNQLEVRREPDSRGALARMASITMVALDIAASGSHTPPVG